MKMWTISTLSRSVISLLVATLVLIGQGNCNLQRRDVIPIESDVRLVGGEGDHDGRLEIYHDGQWGTVCNDFWDQKDSIVVCRQLGYKSVVNVFNARETHEVGSTETPIWMDNVICVGNETELADCDHNGWGGHNCGHGEDVALMCSPTEVSEGTLRLVDGISSREGRLEIYHDEQWGSIAFTNFTSSDTEVVCRQLGFQFAVRHLSAYGIFGMGSSSQYPIWLDGEGVTCSGDELRLDACSHAGWGNTTTFTHFGDLGVICSSVSSSDDITLADRIRLVGGPGPHAGRVEIFYQGLWGTVSDDGWDRPDGHVVCRQLGYPTVSTVIHGNQWSGLDFGGPGNGTIWLTRVQCTYSAKSLYECSHSVWTVPLGSTHETDAGVVCETEESITPENSLRLVGGLTTLQGRLEIFHFGVWGTVCDDKFTIMGANVACRELGFLEAYQFMTAESYGFGDGPTLLESVVCNGNESILADCAHSGWGNHDCSHAEDIAIMCSNGTTDGGADDLSLRLVGGETAIEGRLEIVYSGRWGTVCDDSFDFTDGDVACRQLGFVGVARVITDTTYGLGEGPILLDDLQCIGQEERLADCPNSGIGNSNCQHSEDVGLQCFNTTRGEVSEGSIRLVNGQTQIEGRLEIYHTGQWGTICDDYFEGADAQVVCNQLGFSGWGTILVAGTTERLGHDAVGMPIWLDNINCVGNESALVLCDHPGWGVQNCGHGEDVGLVCTNDTTADAQEGNLRLVGGPASDQGRLEIHHDGVWGTVCDDLFASPDAQVACKQLGFLTHVEIVTQNTYGAGLGPIWLDDLSCTGTESSLGECSHAGWSQSNCNHGEDVGIICSNRTLTTPTPPVENSLRIIGSEIPSNGRLEVYHSGQWGTICDDYFDIPDARVACQQLGYLDTAGVVTNTPEGSGPIWLDDVRCTGNERALSECEHNGWGQNNCGHGEDIGIICTNRNSSRVPDGSLRLAAGPGDYEGRLEVYHEGLWGTVCNDNFDESDGTVACKQLGHDGFISQSTWSTVGSIPPGTGRIWLSELGCNGVEAMLTDCSHSGWGPTSCTHPEDVRLICYNETTVPDQTIRLVGIGSTPLEGRLEVYHGNIWGTVCDDYFDTPDAQVVCRQLGFDAVDRVVIDDRYGIVSGSIWLDDVSCNGDEERFEDCGNNGWGVNNCGHSEDVGIICLNSSATTPGDVEGAVRLVSNVPSAPNEGRLEIYHDDAWGTICDDAFETVDGTVACRQLGFTAVTAIVTDDRWGAGAGPIWLDDLSCSELYSTIHECGHNGWGTHNCGHSEDIGIICSDAEVIATTTASFQVNSLRLVGGPSAMRGRLEIYHDGQWGTVCDDLFSLVDAHVACRQLGFSDATEVITNDIYGIGTGEIWLDDVSCIGSEQSLDACGNNGWSINNCGHSEDIAIACNNVTNDFTYLGCFRDAEVRAIPNNMLNNPAMTLELCFEHCQSFGGTQQYAALQYITECWCGGRDTDYSQYGTAAEEDCNSPCGGDPQQMCGGGWRNSVYSLFSHTVTAENDLRLVGGASPSEGRLEIYHSGQWGTICDDLFETVDGNVACSQLGLGPVQSILTDDPYGIGTGPIWMDDLECLGGEASIGECYHRGWNDNNCRHVEDIAIVCGVNGTTVSPTPGGQENTLRLVGGGNPYEGRLEIYHSGTWGTVCDDYFTLDVGSVACAQLGYGEALAIVTDDSFGVGSGTIWLDDLRCVGTETSLLSCTNPGWGVNNCGHGEDVGIVCSSAGNPECYVEPWGQDYRGFVNVTNTGIPCQRWTSQTPHEHTRTEENLPGGKVGDHNYCRNPDREPDPGGPWCYSTDPEIRWQFCDVGTPSDSCTDQGGSIAENSLRLVSSSSSALRGRLEVYHNGEWGTICDDDFDLTDGGVACRQLGFVDAVSIDDPTVYATADILLDNIRCTGTEVTLADCPNSGWGVHNCGHSEDVVLVCTDTETAELGREGELRLVDGSGDHEGRVEIYHSESWGTICDDNWGEFDGRVVCSQLGFASLDHVTVGASFGQGTGEIWMDQVTCEGFETALIDCTHNGWGAHNCGHGEDAGVVCSQVSPTGPAGGLRLVAGTSPMEGRLEIFHQQEWGTVCDDYFDITDAQVACRQLGYSGGTLHTAPDGTGRTWLDDLQCLGEETLLTDCPNAGWGVENCGHSEDVGISCQPAIGENEGTVRLVEGSNRREGRVEINHANQWGTICGNTWGINEGIVVCKQLGFPSVYAIKTGAYFGEGIGTVFNSMACRGSEERLLDCAHDNWAATDCGHDQDVGVICLKGNLPIISNCPEDRLVSVKAGSAGTPVHWTEPTARDPDGNNIPVLFRTHDSGSSFYLGSTIVTYIFLDRSNGVEKCSFTITGQLLDVTPPRISDCPADQTVNVELGQDYSEFTWPEPHATDSSGNATLRSRSHSPGFRFPLGSTTVVYTFTDSSANQAVCSFDVIVNTVDTKPPVINNCPSDLNVLLTGDSWGKIVRWPQPMAIDVSGNSYLLLQSHQPGVMLPPGVTVVTYVFSDPSHNLAKCSFNVNVNSGSVTFYVSMTMKREFNDALNDPSSPDFSVLKKTLVSTMDDILDASSLAPMYSMTEIRRFRRGSIVADCRVHLNPDQQSQGQNAPLGLSKQSNDDVQSIIFQILQQAAQPNGPLADLGVDPSSLTVQMQTRSATAPVISSCPKTIKMSIKPDASDAIVSWVPPTATDASGIVPLVSKSHAPGSTFEIGSTVVKYTFGRTPVDTSSCVFVVDVQKGDVDIVVMNCPDDISAQDNGDGKGTNVKWKEPSAIYKSKNTTIVFQSHQPGDVFAAGNTMVSYVFAASNGVEASCDFAVIVDGKGELGKNTSGGHGLSVAGLVIAIMVAFILLLLLAGVYMLYRRRKQSGYAIEMQGTSFDGPPSPLQTSEYKSLF